MSTLFDTLPDQRKELAFFVLGTPAPGGSKSAFPIYRGGNLVMKNGRPIIRMVDAGGKSNEVWKRDVALQARSYMRGAKPVDGPLKVEFVFFLRRPLRHYRTGEYADILRPDAPEFHTQAPDSSKFARSTEDALSSVLWADDSQIVRVCSEKRWASMNEKTGCAVRVILL